MFCKVHFFWICCQLNTWCVRQGAQSQLSLYSFECDAGHYFSQESTEERSLYNRHMLSCSSWAQYLHLSSPVSANLFSRNHQSDHTANSSGFFCHRYSILQQKTIFTWSLTFLGSSYRFRQVINCGRSCRLLFASMSGRLSGAALSMLRLSSLRHINCTGKDLSTKRNSFMTAPP